MPLCISFLSLVCFQSPFSPRLELMVLQGKVIAEATPKDNLSRAEPRYGVSLVVVDEEGSGHTVCVQGTRRGNVVEYQSFTRFYAYFCTFVCPGIVVG